MKKLLERVSRESEKYGLMVKCYGYWSSTLQCMKAQVLSNYLVLSKYERVYKFIYPGSVARKGGSSTEETWRRITLRRAALSWNALLHRNIVL